MYLFLSTQQNLHPYTACKMTIDLLAALLRLLSLNWLGEVFSRGELSIITHKPSPHWLRRSGSFPGDRRNLILHLYNCPSHQSNTQEPPGALWNKAGHSIYLTTHRNMFPGVQLTICLHWFSGTNDDPVYWRMYAALAEDELHTGTVIPVIVITATFPIILFWQYPYSLHH